MFGIVAPFSPHVLDFVARPSQGAFKGLVGHPPVAAVNVEVVGAVLQKDSEWLRLVFAYQSDILAAAAQIYERTNGTKHATECRWTLPSSREGANGTAADASDGAVVTAF